ncbi:MAG: type II toxin-antitoxin system VapC family toxin [Leptospiraceae bacterium]|nr:type II toxin-antitoxin system VapC family toxin [Leptospiraceae bacterium]
MAQNKPAYRDTTALIAFLDRSDSWHAHFYQLFARPPRLITSSLVIAEGHGWFLKRYDEHRALQFINFIDSLSALSIHQVGPKEIQQSAKLIKKYKDQSLTIADACGLYLMETKKIRICWSTDHHLGITGVPLAIHQ